MAEKVRHGHFSPERPPCSPDARCRSRRYGQRLETPRSGRRGRQGLLRSAFWHTERTDIPARPLGAPHCCLLCLLFGCEPIGCHASGSQEEGGGPTNGRAEVGEARAPDFPEVGKSATCFSLG